MAGKKGMKPYPPSIKLEAVRLFLEEGKTRREVMKRFGIVNETQLKDWCRQYRMNGVLGLQSKPKGRPASQVKCDELNRLKMENEILRNFALEIGRG